MIRIRDFAERDFRSSNWHLFLMRSGMVSGPNGEVMRLNNQLFFRVEERPLDEGTVDGPSIIDDVDEEGLLQTIMDALWEAGMRPRGYRAETDTHKGELTATKAHLQDMRALVQHLTSAGLLGASSQPITSQDPI